MKYFSFLLICIICSLSVNAQNEDFREVRKGKLFFKLGTEYRITPLPIKAGRRPEARFTNPELQNSGVAIHYGLDFFATKNLSFGFANSFMKGHAFAS